MFCDPEDDNTNDDQNNGGETNDDQIESDETIDNPDGDPVY